MSGAADIFRAALIGIGGTIVLDLWALFLERVMNIPALNWSMVGRWMGNMTSGRFVHQSMAKAEPVPGETAIGWAAHYLIGMSYGLLLLAFWGRHWMSQPTLLPPLILSWVLLFAPYFVMMPGMGSGLAGAKTPQPNLTRLKSLIGHSVFGLGMYGTAVGLAHAGHV
jgi:hypothetical protein